MKFCMYKTSRNSCRSNIVTFIFNGSVKVMRILGFFICCKFGMNCVAQDLRVKLDERLGNGYDVAIVSESTSASWENIVHRRYLRYKKKKICLIGNSYALSPDKRFLVYQGGSENKIFLLDKKTHNQEELVSKSLGLVRKFDWNAKKGSLKIDIYDKEPFFVQLPITHKNDPRTNQ